MALSLTIAAGLIAYDLLKDSISQSLRQRHRIASLSAKVNQLKSETVSEKKKLEAARKELSAREKMQVILLAPDVRKFQLNAPDPNDLASGVVSISKSAGGALLKVAGLPAPDGSEVYDAWWMYTASPPAKAAEFRSAIDGTATEYLDLPPPGPAPIGVIVTLEPSEGGIRPTGPEKLRGKLGK